MKFGFVLPKGTAREAADLAVVAEDNNWDGFFVWEPVWGIDAWISLTAAAMVTENIKLGTLISPISRMRPWKLASETATLDQLSKGRVILSVGLGAIETGWDSFGEITDRKTRVELMDECLDIVQGLWKAKPFSYEGKHYKISEYKHFPPPSTFNDYIPIWVVGAWNWPKSMARTLKYNGIIPAILDKNKKHVKNGIQTFKQIAGYIDQNRNEKNFDIVVESHNIINPYKTKEKLYESLSDVGATWWIEGLWDLMEEPDLFIKLQNRLKEGP